MATRDQVMTSARDARSADEVERAMVALAALPDDADVVEMRSELSERLDALTRGQTPALSREMSRYVDMTRDPGADNW